MASTTPVRRSARLAEKEEMKAEKEMMKAEAKAMKEAEKALMKAEKAAVKASAKKVVEDTHYRNLTPEEMKADLELRTKMLPICEAIRAAAKRPRTNEDFKLIEKAAEKLYEMSRGIVYDSMDEFFIIDIIHISREAKIGDENHKWTIQACNNYINALKSRMEKQPTRTFDPK
jgi:hypothetical protein